MKKPFDFTTVDEILDRYPKHERSTIAILQDIQEVYHYLPEEIFPYVAKAIGVGEARLYGAATFYENFSLEAKGKYVIRCCDGTACHVRKSIPVIEEFRKILDLAPEQATTKDMMFTLETVSCLGACGLAPVLNLDGKVHAAMTPEKARELIANVREEDSYACN